MKKLVMNDYVMNCVIGTVPQVLWKQYKLSSAELSERRAIVRVGSIEARSPIGL